MREHCWFLAPTDYPSLYCPACRTISARTEHVVDVMRSGCGINVWGCYASCVCGWASPAKRTPAEAAAAAAEHLADEASDPSVTVSE